MCSSSYLHDKPLPLAVQQALRDYEAVWESFDLDVPARQIARRIPQAVRQTHQLRLYAEECDSGRYLLKRTLEIIRKERDDNARWPSWVKVQPRASETTTSIEEAVYTIPDFQ